MPASLGDDQVVELVAKHLREAYVGEPIAPVRDELNEGGIEAAYAVQQRNTQLWQQEGRRVVGRKIGLTSPAVQRQLGVDQPDFGSLFADMCLSDGEPVIPGTVQQPRVEAEVALVLSRDLEAPDV